MKICFCTALLLIGLSSFSSEGLIKFSEVISWPEDYKEIQKIAISPDGESVFYLRWRKKDFNSNHLKEVTLYKSSLSNFETKKVELGKFKDSVSFKFTPKGNMLILNTEKGIFRIDMDLTTLGERISRKERQYSDLKISPDGRILIASTMGDSFNNELELIFLDGTATNQILYQSTRQSIGVTFSEDSNSVFFYDYDLNDGYGLFYLDLRVPQPSLPGLLVASPSHYFNGESIKDINYEYSNNLGAIFDENYLYYYHPIIKDESFNVLLKRLNLQTKISDEIVSFPGNIDVKLDFKSNQNMVFTTNEVDEEAGAVSVVNTSDFSKQDLVNFSQCDTFSPSVSSNFAVPDSKNFVFSYYCDEEQEKKFMLFNGTTNSAVEINSFTNFLSSVEKKFDRRYGLPPKLPIKKGWFPGYSNDWSYSENNSYIYGYSSFNGAISTVDLESFENSKIFDVLPPRRNELLSRVEKVPSRDAFLTQIIFEREHNDGRIHSYHLVDTEGNQLARFATEEITTTDLWEHPTCLLSQSQRLICYAKPKVIKNPRNSNYFQGKEILSISDPF